MKKLLFALALMMIGGVSLSTASTANAAPALAGIGQASEAAGGIQLVGGYHGHHRGYRYHHRYYRYGYHYKPYYNYDWYPPYKGYCYDYPYHWWCKKYFHKGY
jgi:hypothetical protein